MGLKGANKIPFSVGITLEHILAKPYLFIIAFIVTQNILFSIITGFQFQQKIITKYYFSINLLSFT